MQRSLSRKGLIVGAAIALANVCATDAHAQRVDGVYGRLDHDTALSVEAGGGIAVSNGALRPGFSATIRARALDTLGLFAGYDHAFGAVRHDAISLGLDLRVLTLGRIFSDLERGPRTLDLFLDSITLELGASLVRPGERWGQGSGIAWIVGGGAELPLYWNQGTALMFRASVRWIHASAFDPHAPSAQADDAVFVTGSLVLRTMASLGHTRTTR
ncbi:MAG: hypothetical protein Q8Q09_06830 [Deltaproteobacteria bacterium]|nr:hypothetical protein [Deltaproteobacteria bacterium]